MDKESTQTHQAHLDSLRGIAALIVVFTHYIGAFFPFAAFANQGSYQQRHLLETIFFYPPFGLLIAGHMAVCLFFILSGYVLSYNYLGMPGKKIKLLGAIVKRPIRLGGVVLFTVTLSALLWTNHLYYNDQLVEISLSKPWFFDLWKGQFALNDFLLNISRSLFDSADIYNIALWTIQVELYGSILVFLTLLLFADFKYRLIVFSILILVFAQSFYQGFFLGMLIADLVKHKPVELSARLKQTIAVLLGLMFLYIGAYPHYANIEYIKTTVYHWLPADTGYEGGYPMLAALLLFCFICLNEQVKKGLQLPLLKYLGKISYGVYGVHILVIGSLSSWMFLLCYQQIGYLYAFIISFVAGLTVIILVGHLITIYVDRPAIKLANYAGNKFVGLLQVLSLKFSKIKQDFLV